MKTLTHEQKIYLNTWGKQYGATVGTLEGYTTEYNGNIEEALRRAIKNRHELAWTISRPCVITSDKGYYEREAAQWESAIELTAGETVTIEGRIYTVKPMGKQYADPIHFIPAA